MTEFEAIIKFEMETEDVAKADSELRAILEGASMNPNSDLEGFRVKDALSLDVFEEGDICE